MAFSHPGTFLDDIKDRLHFAGGQQPRGGAYDEPYDDYYDGDDFVPGDDYGPYAYDEARDASYVEPTPSSTRSIDATSSIRYPRLVTMEEAAASASNLGVAAEERERAARAASHHENTTSSFTAASSGSIPRVDEPQSIKEFKSPYASSRQDAAEPEPRTSQRDANAGVTEVLNTAKPSTREPHTSSGLNGLFEPTTSAVRSVSSRRGTHVVRPLAYRDVSGVAAIVKDGDVAVLDLRSTDAELSSRLLDFSFGVASALDARVERPFDGVFALCTGTGLTADEKAKLQQQGLK